MAYLFLFTIGPVQEFIAAARRTRDLYTGSQILSELSREAAKVLHHEYKAELIFPAQNDLDAHEVVNRIVGQVSDLDEQSARLIGCDVEKKIRTKPIKLRDDIFNNTERIRWSTTPQYRTIAEQQVDDLVEIYWAAVPRTSNY